MKMNPPADYKHAVPNPDDITRVELENGIVVLARANFNSPSISITGMLHVGSMYDQLDKLGLAAITAGALMRGTQDRNFQQIFNELESVGASLGYAGGTHTTGFHGKSLAEDIDLLLEIIGDTLRNSVFPEEQIERQKAQVLTGLALRAQSTSETAGMNFDKLLYPEHPYGLPNDGFVETVNLIDRDDLLAFNQKHYGPKGMVIVVAGGIEPQDAVDKVRQILGGWQNTNQPEIRNLPEWKPLSQTQRIRAEIPEMSQSDVVIGTAGPARSYPDFLHTSLANSIFGQFGMMGRIGEVVREKAGLAYYAYSSLGSSYGPGPWSVVAGVNPSNEEKVVDLIKKEIKKLISEKVTEEELADVKANYIGRVPLSLEANISVAATLLQMEKHQFGLDYLVRYPDLVNSITREGVQAAAANYLDPDRLVISIAGPPLED